MKNKIGRKKNLRLKYQINNYEQKCAKKCYKHISAQIIFQKYFINNCYY